MDRFVLHLDFSVLSLPPTVSLEKNRMPENKKQKKNLNTIQSFTWFLTGIT